MICDHCNLRLECAETANGLMCLPCRKSQCRCESFDYPYCGIHDEEFTYEKDYTESDWS